VSVCSLSIRVKCLSHNEFCTNPPRQFGKVLCCTQSRVILQQPLSISIPNDFLSSASTCCTRVIHRSIFSSRQHLSLSLLAAIANCMRVPLFHLHLVDARVARRANGHVEAKTEIKYISNYICATFPSEHVKHAWHPVA
jgi:hypothetical protein